jgi:hypothetical protein
MMNLASSVVLLVAVMMQQQAFVATVEAFVTPASASFVSMHRLGSDCGAVHVHHSPQPLQAFPLLPSFLTADATMITPGDVVADVAIIPDAFVDQVDLVNDPLIQKLVGIFGIVLLLLVGVNALLSQMDSAIENVLVDFERTMRANYPRRWYELEEEEGLEGLDQIQRSVKLIAVMERLQTDDPAFMAKVNDKMATKS